MKLALAAGAVLMLLCQGAVAKSGAVGGWQIERDDDGDCSATYAYQDPADDNARNAVVVAMIEPDGKPVVIISVAHEKWNREKGEEVRADFLIDDQVHAAGQTWTADERALTAVFTDGADDLAEAFGNGRTITLRFDGDEDSKARFEIPRAAQAVGALRLCRQWP